MAVAMTRPPMSVCRHGSAAFAKIPMPAPAVSAIVDIALPVFAIMLAGYVAGRTGILGEASSTALNAFVYWFALPPLLFLATAQVPLGRILNLPYVATFGGGLLVTFIIARVVARLAFSVRGPTATLHGLSAIFANTGYMGIPLFLAAFGSNGALPAVVATVVNAVFVIGLGTVLVELGVNRASGAAAILRRLAATLVKNPLVVAPVAGLAWSASGLALPRFAENFATILGAAAGPCALFAMGLFLVGKPLRAGLGEVSWVVFLKLAVNPLVTWLLARFVFDLDAEYARGAVLLSALPTGALVFVVAQRYDVYVQRSSAIILISTVVSVATVSILLSAYS